MAINKTTNWHLQLFVSGNRGNAERAVQILEKICKQHLAGKCVIELIDVMEDPEAVLRENIIATPSLIRKLPPPVRRIIGDLTDRENLLVGLEIFDEDTH